MQTFIQKNKFIFIFSLVFFITGLYFGARNTYAINIVNSISNKAFANDNNVDLNSFWKVWDTIDKKYPDAKKIDSKKRMYGAISGLMTSLDDPYSTFFNPEESKAFQEEIAGSFSGIGMEVGIKDKIPTVIAPLKDTPSYKAGIKSGDKILKIDGKVTNELKIDDIVKMIRGEKGTVVTLLIFREGEKGSREVKITRDTINIPTLETEKRKDGIFVIRLFTFSANSANLFRDAIEQFKKSGSNKLILDLRNNPGGYLDAAVDMASWFVEKDKDIVVEDYGENAKATHYESLGYSLNNKNLKFVVLINGGSASASEIFSGAMQDYKKAKLVGEQSFGKGSVQEVLDVTDDTIMKITVAKWLTPDGHHIHGIGLTPDYVVPITQKDIALKRDPQLIKAVNLLNNWPK